MMKQNARYFLYVVSIVFLLAGCSWFVVKDGLVEWKELGKVVSLSQMKKLPERLQAQLEELKKYLHLPAKKTEFGEMQKSVVSLLRANRKHMLSTSSSSTAGSGMTLELGAEDLHLKDIGKHTFVLFFDDDNDHIDDWVIEIAKIRWVPPAYEGLAGKRYMYQLSSRMSYAIRINQIIQERDLTHVSTPDSYLVIFNNDIEPNDDNSSYCAKWIKSGGKMTFSELGKQARAGDEKALKLISEMIQIIYRSGLWNVHTRDMLFVDNYKVVFVDHEVPGFGGNPWLKQLDGKAPIKPWLPLNKNGIQTLEGNGKYGVRQFWELLFGFSKDTLFRDEKRTKWFQQNIEHDVLDEEDFSVSIIKKKIGDFMPSMPPLEHS